MISLYSGASEQSRSKEGRDTPPLRLKNIETWFNLEICIRGTVNGGGGVLSRGFEGGVVEQQGGIQKPSGVEIRTLISPKAVG